MAIFRRVSISASPTVHFYDYAADQWDDAAFRIPRMATEYGIQSWCNNESLATVFEHKDFDMTGHMADHRQHHATGTQYSSWAI